MPWRTHILHIGPSSSPTKRPPSLYYGVFRLPFDWPFLFLLIPSRPDQTRRSFIKPYSVPFRYPFVEPYSGSIPSSFRTTLANRPIATPDGMGFRETHMVHVDGKGRHLEHGSLNGEEWFCVVWKRERTLERGDIGGAATWGEGRQCGGESPGRGWVGGSRHASSRPSKRRQMGALRPLVSNEFSPHEWEFHTQRECCFDGTGV